MEEMLRELLARWGAAEVGFARVEDGPDGLEWAVSVVVKLSDQVVEEIQGAPTHSYFHHYRTVNFAIDQMLLQAGMALEREGWRYLPVAASQSINLDGRSPFQGRYSHKKAACLAGLGSIGRSGLFLHPRFGPRVRLGTLFTDCPFPSAPAPRPPEDPCGHCTLCRDACPAGAILGGPAVPGRPCIDPALCSGHMKKAYQLIGRGAVCGICMAVCPKGQSRPRQAGEEASQPQKSQKKP